MADEVADDFKDLTYGPPSPFDYGSVDGKPLYGPPSPAQMDVADGTVFGPPVPGAAKSYSLGDTSTSTSTPTTSSDTSSSDSDFDLSAVLKTVSDVGGQVAKTVGSIAAPFLPKPQIPTAPTPPNLPASLPTPPQPSPAANAPAASAPAVGQLPAKPAAQPTAPAVSNPQVPAVRPKPGMSTGSKVAIGLGITGVLLGGGLLIASSGKKKSR